MIRFSHEANSWQRAALKPNSLVTIIEWFNISVESARMCIDNGLVIL